MYVRMTLGDLGKRCCLRNNQMGGGIHTWIIGRERNSERILPNLSDCKMAGEMYFQTFKIANVDEN